MDLYEQFVKNHPSGTFFQSWAFGELQEKIPYRGKTWRIGNDCLVVKMKMRFGFSWLWLPYASPFAQPAFAELANIAKKERTIFARIEPNSQESTEKVCTYRCKTPCFAHGVNFLPGALLDANPRARIYPSRGRFTPEYTLVLNLEKSEEEILVQMKPKGRYNIQVALKHGVTVHKQIKREVPGRDFDDFYKLLKRTSQRDSFRIHPKFFYEKLLETLDASLFLAYAPHEKRVVAGIIVVYYKDTATYYYGASSHADRALMAPYLLQWEAIREARSRNMKKYDFLGLAPPHEKNHPLQGVTEFKKKFGGEEIHYPPAFDVVYRPFLYKILKLLRRA